MKCYKCGQETNHTMKNCTLKIRIPTKVFPIQWTCPRCQVEYKIIERAIDHDDACSRRYNLFQTSDEVGTGFII